MNTILKDAEGIFKFIGKVFVDIVNALWTTDKQMLLTDLTNLWHAEGVALQNIQPGIGTAAFIQQLIAVGMPLVTGDLVALGVADYHIVAATIAKDLNISDTGGNAGILPGGVQTGS